MQQEQRAQQRSERRRSAKRAQPARRALRAWRAWRPRPAQPTQPPEMLGFTFASRRWRQNLGKSLPERVFLAHFSASASKIRPSKPSAQSSDARVSSVPGISLGSALGGGCACKGFRRPSRQTPSFRARGVRSHVFPEYFSPFLSFCSRRRPGERRVLGSSRNISWLCSRRWPREQSTLIINSFAEYLRQPPSCFYFAPGERFDWFSLSAVLDPAQQRARSAHDYGYGHRHDKALGGALPISFFAEHPRHRVVPFW